MCGSRNTQSIVATLTAAIATMETTEPGTPEDEAAVFQAENALTEYFGNDEALRRLLASGIASEFSNEGYLQHVRDQLAEIQALA